MYKITSIKELNSQIRTVKQSAKTLISNSFLMADDFEQYISQGCLYALPFPDGLAVFLDEGTYYRMLFWCSPDSRLPLFETDRNIICELIYKDYSTKFSNCSNFLQDNHFKKYAENIQFSFSLKDIKYEDYWPALNWKLEDNGYVCRLGTQNDYADVLGLWKENLDEYAFDLLTSSKCMDAICNDSLFLIEDAQNGTICAGAIVLAGGGTIEIRHIAVSPSHRGKHLGLAVTLWAFQEYCKRGFNKCTCWTNSGNTISTNLYQKLGIATSKHSVQFVLMQNVIAGCPHES